MKGFALCIRFLPPPSAPAICITHYHWKNLNHISYEISGLYSLFVETGESFAMAEMWWLETLYILD